MSQTLTYLLLLVVLIACLTNGAVADGKNSQISSKIHVLKHLNQYRLNGDAAATVNAEVAAVLVDIAFVPMEWSKSAEKPYRPFTD
ncbi:hypothetical protein TSAR_014037 [Trichomalopsis sarcophagae]|uniref:Uncharacterized protein n=1 Tax=Trichomalopsis sarcophagae TaxID=543379 RepID=A0A232EV04_9HYME|nr:hypothetical protein TSAR_014037 [Trichomalopsis sarcophagae]